MKEGEEELVGGVGRRGGIGELDSSDLGNRRCRRLGLRDRSRRGA